MKPLCYLNTKKGNAGTMLAAFAAGSGAEITKRLEMVPGRLHVFWGIDPATLQVWNAVRSAGEKFVYVDNGYMVSKWQGGDHYRMTLNAEQHSGLGTSDGLRWRKLGLQIAPWRKDGGHILIVCQSDFWHERHGQISAKAYAQQVLEDLRRYTDRPVVVRRKPLNGVKEPPLRDQINGAWAIVSYSSMVALEGLLAGVPAFVLGPTAAAPVALDDLSKIETPYYPDDRERWVSVLADNQWRLGEIQDGMAWRALNA